MKQALLPAHRIFVGGRGFSHLYTFQSFTLAASLYNSLLLFNARITSYFKS